MIFLIHRSFQLNGKHEDFMNEVTLFVAMRNVERYIFKGKHAR